MLVPHDNERVRSVQVSSSGVRALIALVLLLAGVSGLFSVGFLVKGSQHLRAERLERENVLLAAEVEEMRGDMEGLSASLEDLSEKDEKYRTMAGLPSIDADVRKVGIGGPGTATLATATAAFRSSPEIGAQVFSASYDLETLIRRAGLLRTSMDEAIGTLRDNTERLESTPSISPSDGHLSSLFSRNRRHPVLRITRPHKGIDIAAPVGEPILAPAKGTVVFSGTRAGGYGRTIEIDHGYGYVTRFAHCSRLLVREGDTVERGQVIAEVGATGLTSGPHLHYEVEVNGLAADPLNFIIADAIPD
jgi:murein DD-endopeptidase MepM/ murein hydrolase activator NlpD